MAELRNNIERVGHLGIQNKLIMKHTLFYLNVLQIVLISNLLSLKSSKIFIIYLVDVHNVENLTSSWVKKKKLYC